MITGVYTKNSIVSWKLKIILVQTNKPCFTMNQYFGSSVVMVYTVKRGIADVYIIVAEFRPFRPFVCAWGLKV